MTGTDWLLDPQAYRARVVHTADGIVLDNGLVRRTFRTQNGFATVALEHLESLLRSVRPEASLVLDGVRYDVGGLLGQPVHNAVLPTFLEEMQTDPAAFALTAVDEGQTQAPFDWTPRKEWLTVTPEWPAPGVSVTFRCEPPSGAGLEGMSVDVRYELYDGLPVISKQLVLHNYGTRAVVLNSFVAETLAIAAPAPPAMTPSEGYGSADVRLIYDRIAPLHVQTDYAFGAAMVAARDNPAVTWSRDTAYTTGLPADDALLVVEPPVGPEAMIVPGETFETFRVFELLHDSTERERRGLAVRRMMRVLAPWVQENPLIFHVRSTDPAVVKPAIDQAADAGFELVILSFGSGLSMEDDSADNVAAMKELADYAHGRGIALGGYSLLASRAISPADDVVDPAPRFGASPCLGSRWGQRYFDALRHFLDATGFDCLEHDGSYPGDLCASTEHPGHRDANDSQWNQWRSITGFYAWARSRGIYLTVPDWYFLAGSSRIGMGYVEENWSLPRAQQEIIERQNVYDGTWEKTPSMGWMHVPLVQYHGGGAEATLEPLHEHLPDYERRLANLFGAGVTGVFRGTRLYDADRTRAAVVRWVQFFRQYRDLLDADIVHCRRADGRDLDYLLHARPLPEPAGLLMLYNPMHVLVERELLVPLRHVGLTVRTTVHHPGGEARVQPLDADQRLHLSVRVGPHSSSYYIMKPAP
ncbi:hypothetical protein JOF29_007247 [Kribbella aluminosa]|uniref:Alpha-galactosidase n=1 Tax=Kribbella aluminosa TaxID=416017 RepID=A0ABS4UWW8_9ACTN|nr:hypothetical protein [Kribbella aluminosa]MBP2356137.1 hypothetical protein [Kribbella aluminosa]